MCSSFVKFEMMTNTHQFLLRLLVLSLISVTQQSESLCSGECIRYACYSTNNMINLTCASSDAVLSVNNIGLALQHRSGRPCTEQCCSPVLHTEDCISVMRSGHAYFNDAKNTCNGKRQCMFANTQQQVLFLQYPCNKTQLPNHYVTVWYSCYSQLTSSTTSSTTISTTSSSESNLFISDTQRNNATIMNTPSSASAADVSRTAPLNGTAAGSSDKQWRLSQASLRDVITGAVGAVRILIIVIVITVICSRPGGEMSAVQFDTVLDGSNVIELRDVEWATGDVNMVSVEEPFRVLREHLQEEFSKVLLGCSADGGGFWKTVGHKLGLTNDEVNGIDARRNCDNKAFEMLRMWRQRPDTTIRVMRNTLTDLNLNAAVKDLDDIRFNYVKPEIVICLRDVEWTFLNSRCPGKKTLMEYVRPHITRKLASPMLHSRIFLIQLHDNDIEWSTPMIKIGETKRILTMTELPADDGKRRKTEERSNSGCEYIGKRNGGITSTDTVILFASSCDTTGYDSAATSDDESVYENELTQEPELRQARRVYGFREVNSDGQPEKQWLKHHLQEDGRYALRLSTSLPNAKLTLCFTFSGAIHVAYIYSKTENSVTSFSLHSLQSDGREDLWFNCLDDFMEYYKAHTLIDGQNAFLVEPITDEFDNV